MKPIRILQLLFQGWLLGFLHRNGHGLSNTTEPGYLDFDNLPETNFTCQGKVIGGYYADLETECQMFHVCTIGQLDEPMDIKFLCLNGTVFDQETRVCERVDEVDCSRSEKFYSLNLELYGNTVPPPVEDEKEEEQEEHSYSKEFSHPSTIPHLTTSAPIVTTVKIATSSTTETEHNRPSRVNKTTQALPSYPTADEEDYNYPTDSDEDNDKCSGQETDQHYDVYGSESKNHDCDKSVDSKLLNPPSSHSFSPQQFILKHADIHGDQKNPAISFQRQFQNGGTNTLVTVTTHTNLFQDREREKQPLYHDQNGFPTSTQDSSFREYTERPIIHSTERTPLIPLPNSQDRIPTGHPGLPSKTNSYGSLYGYAQDDTEKNSRYNPIDGQELQLQFRKNREPNHSEFKKKEPRVFTRSENRTEVNTFTHSPYSGALPRVIVTATATVRDGSGKKLNYTVSSVIGGAGDKMPPASYDDYKESDVLLDPFFLDVPKIKRMKRTARLKSN